MSTTLFTAGSLILVAGMAALAQDLPEPHQRTAAPPAAGQDAGRSQPITRADVPGLIATRFAALDTDGDGAITRAEYEARRGGMGRRGDGSTIPPHIPSGATGMGGGGRGLGAMMGGPRWFDTADANGDGRVTLAEAQAAALATFDRLDADHDGTLTPEERRAGMMAMRGRAPG